MELDDDLDLSGLLRPVPAPEGGAARARRTVTRRRMARRVVAGVTAASLAVVGLAAVRAADEPWPREVVAGPAESATRGLLVVRNGGGRRGVIVSPNGARTRVLIPGSDSNGDRYVIPRQGGFVVGQWNGEQDQPVWALRPPFRRPGLIGLASRVIPSRHRERVWLVKDDQKGFTTSVTELGGNSASKLTFTCCRRVVADSGVGLLAQGQRSLEVWDVAGARITRTLDGFHELAAVSGTKAIDLLSECDRDASTARLWDLGGGSPRPLGDRCSFVGPGEFAPDGATVALWSPTDGAGSSLALVPLDGTAAIAVPDSNSAEYQLAWDPRGRVYFVGDIYGEVVRSFDPRTGASQLMLDAGGVVSGLAYLSG